MKKSTGAIFVMLGIVVVGLAVWKVLPDEASKPCLMGYFAHCSFTPISTTILVVLSVIFVLLSWKLLKRP